MRFMNTLEMVLGSMFPSTLKLIPSLRLKESGPLSIQELEVSAIRSALNLSMRSWKIVSAVCVDGISHVAERDYKLKTYTDSLQED